MQILFALLVACVGLQAVERPRQPNVLWITAEDMSPELEEPTVATHHTPQPARLRRLRSVVISWWSDCHPDECGFQGVLTVAPEQQPCGVQVVERVGLTFVKNKEKKDENYKTKFPVYPLLHFFECLF